MKWKKNNNNKLATAKHILLIYQFHLIRANNQNFNFVQPNHLAIVKKYLDLQ